MNRKEIKMQLQKEAEEHSPEIYERIASADCSDTGEIVAFSSEKQSKRAKKSRLHAGKVLRLAAIGTAAVICLSIVLPVCIYAFSEREVVPGNYGTGVSLSATQVYGLGAVTTVALLDQTFDSPSVASLSLLRLSDETQSAEEPKLEQLEKFHEYFLMLESFWGDDLVSTTTQENTDEEYAQYEIKCVVTGYDLYGNSVSHLMYYTETLVKEKTEKNETEREYALQGVMVTENGDYVLSGERTMESETKGSKTETEEELTIRAYPEASDRRNYVQMEQEVSVEEGETEIEYVYSVVKDGKVVEKTALEFESERKGDKQEVEFKLEFLSGAGKGVYKLEKEIKNGISGIQVKYEIDGISDKFTVLETDEGRYLYLFSDGKTLIF